MSKNFLKILSISILAFLITTLDRGLFSYYYPNFNLSLSLTIFLSANYSRKGIFFALLTGLLFDIFSIFPFFIFTLSFFSSAWLVKILGEKFFILKNLLPLLIIIILGTLTYHLVFYFLVQTTYFLKINNFQINLDQFYLNNLLFNLIGQIIFVSLLMFLVYFFQKKIKKYESIF